MADSFTIKVNGLAELERRLLDFGPKIAANGLRAANYAATKTILDAVKQTAPVQTGTLKANLVISRRRAPQYQQKHSVVVRQGTAKYANTRLNRRLRRVGKKHKIEGPAYYAKFVEFGSSKMRARPFMRPAFVSSVDRAIDAFRARLEKAVVQAAKK